MSNTVIVRINDKLIPEFQINYNQSENIATRSDVNSWADVNLTNKDKLIVLISANLIYTSVVSIPSKNDEIIRQSIPYTIEEELATDIEFNHFAYNKGAEQNLVVSVIDRNVLQQLLDELKQNGLVCKSIYSEIYGCPNQKGITTICVYKDFLIVRDEKNGSTIRPSMLNKYLKLSQAKQKVVFSGSELKIKSQSNIINKITDMSVLQAQTICNSDGVNLLQGEFAQKNANKKRQKPWTKFIILIAVLITSWLFINIYQISQLNKDIQLLKQSQKSILSKNVPNLSESELNDPYSAMLSRLKINENSSNKNKQGFIQALIYVGKTLQQYPNIEIVSLRHRNAKLEVKLQAADVGSLNMFRQSLEKSAYSMRVKTGTRDSNENGFSSTITMEQI